MTFEPKPEELRWDPGENGTWWAVAGMGGVIEAVFRDRASAQARANQYTCESWRPRLIPLKVTP